MKLDVTSFAEAWSARSPRERAMLGALGALIVVLGGWYGLYDPLRRAAQDARKDRDAAAARLAVVEAAATEVRRATAAHARLSAADLDRLVADSAAQSGLTVEAPRRDGEATVVRAPAASPPVLFAWVQGLQTRGAAVRGFSAARGAGGTVDAEVRLAGS